MKRHWSCYIWVCWVWKAPSMKNLLFYCQGITLKYFSLHYWRFWIVCIRNNIVASTICNCFVTVSGFEASCYKIICHTFHTRCFILFLLWKIILSFLIYRHWKPFQALSYFFNCSYVKVFYWQVSYDLLRFYIIKYSFDLYVLLVDWGDNMFWAVFSAELIHRRKEKDPSKITINWLCTKRILTWYNNIHFINFSYRQKAFYLKPYIWW